MPPEEPSPPPPPIPDYEPIRLVGHGSYGDVWVARGATGLYRAIKIVWRHRFADLGPYEREFKGLSDFMRFTQGEARQLALLHVGRNDAQGFFYYVMELADDVVTGREIDPACYAPLTLKVLRDTASHLPAAQVLRYGVELAAGLAELHAAGLIHRDIKPSNIILVDGRPKLADIGLVSVATEAMTFVGTEGFVPPEGPGSPAADVYSLGKVLYEIATGRDRQDFPRLPINLATRGDRADYLELNEIIIKACAPLPQERYPSAEALLHELKLIEAGKSVRRLRFAERGLSRARRWIAVAVIAALVAGTGAAWERNRANIEAAGRRAAEQELAALSRRTLYDGSLAAAQRALETGNYGVAREALERAIPAPGDPDLRRFEWHALYREAQGDPAQIIRASGDQVTRLEASADGRWVAIDNVSPTVEIHDQQSGSYVRTLTGIHRIVGYTPDGTRLVGTTPDYAIETWSLTDGTPDPVPAKPGINRPLQTHPDLPHILYFEDGPDEEPHQLGIWNYETGEPVVVWPIPKIDDRRRWVFMEASATPDLSRAVVITISDLAGERPRRLRVIDLKTGEVLATEESVSLLDPAAISPSGDWFVCRPSTLKLRSIGAGAEPPRFFPYDAISPQIEIDRHGAELLVGASDLRLVLVDVATGDISREFVGSGSQISAFTYASDHREIWSADRRGEVRRWYRHGSKAAPVTASFPTGAESRISHLKISADSDQLLTIDSTSQLTVGRLSDLEVLWRRGGVLTVVHFGNDELLLLTADRKLQWRAAADGQLRGDLAIFDPGTAVAHAIGSSDGRWVLAFSADHEIALWDTTTGQRVARYSEDRLDCNPEEFLSLVLTNDAAVISIDVRQTLLRWSGHDGTVVVAERMPDQPGNLNLSPRGDYIAVSGGATPTTLRDARTLAIVHEIEEGRSIGVDYAFHPTEPEVVTQFMRGSLTALNIETGQRRARLEIQSPGPGSELQALVSNIEFSPDGKCLATIDHTGGVRVWRR